MRNPFGTIARSQHERGSRDRKEEGRLRGFRRRGRQESIEEQQQDRPCSCGCEDGVQS